MADVPSSPLEVRLALAEDERASRRAFITRTSWTSFTVASLALVTLFVADPVLWPSRILFVVLTTLFPIGALLAKRNINAGGAVLLFVPFLMAIGPAMFFPANERFSFAIAVALTVTAGFLFGRKAAFVATLLSSVCIVVMQVFFSGPVFEVPRPSERVVTFGWAAVVAASQLIASVLVLEWSRLADKARARAEHELTRRELALLEAQRANTAKSTFLASMSHEIRTPLNGVLGMSQLLMQSKLHEEDHHKVKMIIDSGKNLLGLLNDLLDLSKVEAGKMDLNPEVFFPVDLMASLRDFWAPRAKEKGLSLALEVPDQDLPPCTADTGRIRQVINNFLSNAIKFTPEGGVTIRLEVEGSGAQQNCGFRLSIQALG